jgi:hypothetical protein
MATGMSRPRCATVELSEPARAWNTAQARGPARHGRADGSPAVDPGGPSAPPRSARTDGMPRAAWHVAPPVSTPPNSTGSDSHKPGRAGTRPDMPCIGARRADPSITAPRENWTSFPMPCDAPRRARRWDVVAHGRLGWHSGPSLFGDVPTCLGGDYASGQESDATPDRLPRSRRSPALLTIENPRKLTIASNPERRKRRDSRWLRESGRQTGTDGSGHQ